MQLILYLHFIRGCRSSGIMTFLYAFQWTQLHWSWQLLCVSSFASLFSPGTDNVILFLSSIYCHATSTVWAKLQDDGTCVRKCQHSRNKRLFHLSNCSVLSIKLTRCTAGGRNLYPSDLDNNTIGKFHVLIAITAILSINRGWTLKFQS